jgi:hypothetical protein
LKIFVLDSNIQQENRERECGKPGGRFLMARPGSGIHYFCPFTRE